MKRPRTGRTIRLAVLALSGALGLAVMPGVAPRGASAVAMVGGAPSAADGVGRSVVMILGSYGTACTATAIARDLLLTAAHCVQPGADYKLVDNTPGREPILKDIARIERDPQFELKRLFAHLATADVALIKLAAPLPPRIASGVSRRRGRKRGRGRSPRGRGLWRHRARRRPHRRHGSRRNACRHRSARPFANPLVRSQHQRAKPRPWCLCRRFRRAGLSRHRWQSRHHRRRQLVDRPKTVRRLRRPYRYHAARSLSRLDRRYGTALGSPLRTVCA